LEFAIIFVGWESLIQGYWKKLIIYPMKCAFILNNRKSLLILQKAKSMPKKNITAPEELKY